MAVTTQYGYLDDYASGLTLSVLEVIENSCGKDFSGINAKFTEGLIGEQYSSAERKINTYCGTSFSGTIPDAIIDATLIIGKNLMTNLLIEDNAGEGLTKVTEFIKDDVKTLLDNYKIDTDDEDLVDNIYLNSEVDNDEWQF